MWEDLQRQIRSLHVTVRVDGENTDQQPSTSGASSSANPQSSTSNTETQNEPAKNFKKALIESYKRENEVENTSSDLQPSTSSGTTSQKPHTKTSSQAHSSEFGQSSTNISLSNLLPTESELKRMREQSLSDLLETLQEQDSWRSAQLDEPNSQPSAISDHTYSNLTTNNTTVQLPSISSFISNLTASINSPTTTQLLDSTNSINPEEGPSSSRASRTSPSNSTQANPGTEGTSESSNSAPSMDSPSSSTSIRGRQYTYQRVWRYGRRMYLRRPRLLSLGPRSMKRGSRTQFNPFRHYENSRRPWHLRRNDPRSANGSTSNSERTRVQNTSESLQAMIVRLESLVRQQKVLARNSEMNRGSDSDSQSETTNNTENQEMEQIREVTRLRARQVLSLMVESLTQFFEENRPGSGSQSNVLYEQIYKMYVLLHLALQLTDLLLEQLVTTRRELESSQYGPFNSDLTASNPSETNERRSSGIDNGLQTEGTRSAEGLRTNLCSFENTEEARSSDTRDRNHSGIALDSAEYLLSAQGSRNYRNMAEDLRRLFHIPCYGSEQRNETSREPEGSRVPETSRNPENSRQNPSNSRSPDPVPEVIEPTVGQISSENALSAEVQSIVERIQNNRSAQFPSLETDSRFPLETENPLGNDTETRNDLELDEGQGNVDRSEDIHFQRRLLAEYERRSNEAGDRQRNEGEGRTLRPTWQTVTSLPIVRGPPSSRRGPTRYSPLRRERLTSESNYSSYRSRPFPERDPLLSRIRYRTEINYYRNRPLPEREVPVSRPPHRHEFHYYRSRPVPERDRSVFSRFPLDTSHRNRPILDTLLSSTSANRHEFNVPIVQVAPPTPPHTPPSYLTNSTINSERATNQSNSSNELAGPSTSQSGSRNQVKLCIF